jgi:hypothetical protein
VRPPKLKNFLQEEPFFRGQTNGFEGIEASFLRFGGVPEEVQFDNARALVEHHNAATCKVRFND